MTVKPEQNQPRRRKPISKKHLLWAIPVAVAIIAISALLALPGFVSSGYHRATIEALASSLTGRNVHINGKLSLAILPHPQFMAGDITITSPDNETITANSLTLDIAPIPLLRGQVNARAITLESPHIALPWPLPGGAAAIAPPHWLTTLHAQINNGEISLGAADFRHVSADIFTGGPGTFSISGSGSLAGRQVSLSLGFGAISAAGSTPLTLDIQTSNPTDLQAHVSGTFDASSRLTGNTSFSAKSLSWLDPALSQPLSGTAVINATPEEILLSSLNIRQGAANLSGAATINLPHPALSLLLIGKDLTLPADILTVTSAFPALPTHLTLDATNTAIAGHPALAAEHLRTSMDIGETGTSITAFTASQHGGVLSLTGNIDPAGKLQANAGFISADLNRLTGRPAYATLPASWAAADLKFTLNGDADHLMLSQLTGTLGPAKVTGAAVLAQQHSLSGQLHFGQLDLTPMIAMLRDPPRDIIPPGLSGDFEITADKASLGKVPLTHLLADASLGQQLIVRRLSASVYGGIATASFTLTGGTAPDAEITSARAILALPSAARIAEMLPASIRPPAALTKAPLAISILAAGLAKALATSASLTLGDVSITAAPVIDLIDQTAKGAFTLRHPNAIAAFKAFGLNAGLAWPGAGSIALRASLILSPAQIGLSSFVVSMGDLTSNGQLIYGPDHQLNGQIDADTLALPPIPAKFILPWADLSNVKGKINIAANNVLVAGNPILGPVVATVTLNPGKLDLAVMQASLANGSLTGDFSAVFAQTQPAPSTPAAVPVAPAIQAPPAIIAKFALTGADAAVVQLPFAFPVTLPSGRFDVAADLTASGYAPSAWVATLSGNASLAARDGSLNGFNLPALGNALTASKNRSGQLRAASLTGVTPFTNVSVTSIINSGIATLTSASLQSPSGTANATGNIDLPDTGITLALTLLPNVPAPPQTKLTLDGSWTAPHKIPAIKPGLSWKPANNP